MVYKDSRALYKNLYTELKPKRRHAADCPHREAGPNYLNCTCPLAAYGILKGESFRRSLQTRSLEIALDRIRQLERASLDEARAITAPAPTTLGSAIAT